MDQQSSRPQEANGATEDMNNSLLKLARKQGMNTDVRRSIFVVLMSSEVRVGFIQFSLRAERLSRTMLTHATALRN